MHRHPAGAAVVVAPHVEHGSHARGPVGQQAEQDAAHVCDAGAAAAAAAHIVLGVLAFSGAFVPEGFIFAGP